MSKKFRRKWNLALSILPVVAAILVLKYASHEYGLEMLSLNPLFSSILAATVFLFGFLISGVLADYKDSEKIPGDLVCSIEALKDEAEVTVGVKAPKEYRRTRKELSNLCGLLIDWFLGKAKTRKLLASIDGLNPLFRDLERAGAATARMRQEQSNIRRSVIRADTIRTTNFVSSAYAIADALAFFLILGMLLTKMEPLHESLFFVALVSFLIIYMQRLIRDLDNPFDYSGESFDDDEISLYSLIECRKRLE